MKVKLVKTCDACPEQYDAFIDGEYVGFLHLRYGYFSVTCPNGEGEVVYSASPEGEGFFNCEERERHLTASARAIKAWAARNDKLAAAADYEIVGSEFDVRGPAEQVYSAWTRGENISWEMNELGRALGLA